MKVIRFLLFCLFGIGFISIHVKAREEILTEIRSAEETVWDMAETYLTLSELEEAGSMSGIKDFSFRETFKKIVSGEWDVTPEKLMQFILDLLLKEIRQMQKVIISILIIVYAGAVFSNFIRVFENRQIADVGFYMSYLLVSALIVQAFSVMNQTAVNTCDNIVKFMQILLPSYVVTVVLSAGTVTALGFYEITVLILYAIQMVLVKILFPAVHFYVMILILNQLSKEDYFSRFAQLIEVSISWGLKSMLGIMIGMQTIQCLMAPAIDSFHNLSITKFVKLIPGVGGALDAAAETVGGAAVILKNAVGVTGMITLAVLCLIPMLKLTVAIFMFRFVCVLIQPISEKRLVEGIDSAAKGTMLLLRLLLFCVSVFLISLAMMTAVIRNG